MSDSTQTGKHGNRMAIAGLTSDSEPTNTHTGNQLPIAGLMSDSNTHTGVEKEKGRPERSTHLLPTYLIWYEDQGDVVPLNRERNSVLTRDKGDNKLLGRLRLEPRCYHAKSPLS